MKTQLIKHPQLFDYDKYEKETDEIKKISMCLNYIKSKLNTKSISVMVGAGFSKNANTYKNENDSQYEDWLALLVPAYKEMFPDNLECKNDENDKIRKKIQVMGESEFAEKYEKYKGSREFLDLYIENRINSIDKSTDDLSFHYKLLDLNWCDIITTNWDDLLERANAKDEKYTTILSAKELRCRNNDRIVKLHGSIRTDKQIKENEYNFDNTYNYLYLITTTDFERYRTDHEVFSNFMKVKILENPFCLMGFSGRDLNFRYWIKELKRTMQKGGNTEKPNPIFLFDVNPNPTTDEDKEYEKALDLFYHNNYIIRIKILNLYSSSEFKSKFNLAIENCSPQQPNALTYSDLNNFVFEYLKEHKESDKNDIEKLKDINQIESIKDKEYGIIHNIVASNSKLLTVDDFNQYNTVNLFSFQNLTYSRNFIYPVQKLALAIPEWTENHFIFLYRWCLGNYYSLSNLFEEDKIKEIIEKFEKLNYIETDAYVFMELILKYYREHGDAEKLDYYHKRLSEYPKLNNIIMFSKAWMYILKFQYEKLKDLLNNWYPENSTNPDSLFIVRKISLMHIFENVHFNTDKKEEILNLMQIALDNCKEDQLKFFIALYQGQYLNILTYQYKNSNKHLVDLLKIREFSEPYKYLDFFNVDASTKDSSKSNQAKRYSISWKLSGEESNDELINSIRLLNFFEYTGLSMELFMSEGKIISLIGRMKDFSFYLQKIIICSISYFGNDSDEDFLKLVIDKTMRYLKSKEIQVLFNSFLNIFIYKVYNQKNARSYFFLTSEISKYLDNTITKKLNEFIYSEIKNPKDINKQVMNMIQRGKIWGAKTPFEEYLKQIKDEDEYKFIFEWIIKEYILDERELVKKQRYSLSEFFSYYYVLTQLNTYPELIKQVFMKSEIIQLLEEDFSYEKQLCLYGYEYLPEKLKIKTQEFFENNYTVFIDPYFIRNFKSETVKVTIFSMIEEDSVLSFDSRKYPIVNYIKMLYYEKMLTVEDKIFICRLLKKRFEIILNNINYFNFGFRSLDDVISEIYFCIEEITSIQERENNSEMNDVYKLIKSEFINQIKTFYDFKWLYTNDSQIFRISFCKAISYFSFLHEAKAFLSTFNIAITKLIVFDDSNFEAVLELFIKMYSDGYEESVFQNNETHALLLQIMKKYKFEIPYCYDYLFIKKQMNLLAKALKKNGLDNDVVKYWLENDI